MVDQVILQDKVNFYTRMYSGSPYQPFVDRMNQLFKENNIEGTKAVFSAFPTESELFGSLVEKLKDKPVYKTLKKIVKEQTNNPHEMLKGLFSLGTHILIEAEQGRPYYKILLPKIHQQISALLKEV